MEGVIAPAFVAAGFCIAFRVEAGAGTELLRTKKG
jgi:hypothetical protein